MNKILCYLCLSFSIILASCNDEVSGKKAESQGEPTAAAANEDKTPTTTNTSVDSEMAESFDDVSLANFFDEQTIEQLLAVKQAFDNQLCATISHNEISDCYKSHAGILMSDISQDVPFTTNFPYTSTFSLQNIEEGVDNSDILSNKCGFQHSETGAIINYYCLMNKSSFMDYVSALAQQNGFIKKIYDEYQMAKGLTPNIRNSVAMTSVINLDFEQIGHQLFYMMMHLAINEELIASRKFQALENG